MGSLYILRPGHERLPDIIPLPDGRFRVLVYVKFPAPAYTPPAYGDLYDDTLAGDEATRYAGLRLTLIDPGLARGKASVPALVLTYEQLHPTAETQVGKLTTVTDENGRDVFQAQFLQFSSAPRTKGVTGEDTPPGIDTAVLDNENCNDEGILRRITRRYVQADGVFDKVGEDDIDFELNGLKRRTRNLVAIGGITFTETVGTTPHPDDTGLILAGLSIRESKATTKVRATYLKPGVISKRRAPGEITGTINNTWQTWLVDPTSAVDMTACGAGDPIPGVVIADGTDNTQGYPTRSVTTLSGTITGTKATYKDVVEVRTPGTVTLTTQAVSIGGATGTVAVANHVPPRVKTVAATVTIEVTTTPPNTVPQLAFNLEGISCSVTATQASFANLGSDTFTSEDGNHSITGKKSRLSVGADIQTYPNCYYIGGPATGTTTYTGAYEPTPADLSGPSIIMSGLDNTVQNTLTGSGATAAGEAEGYFTTGIIQRRARPILTTLAGVTYWEVITYSV